MDHLETDGLRLTIEGYSDTPLDSRSLHELAQREPSVAAELAKLATFQFTVDSNSSFQPDETRVQSFVARSHSIADRLRREGLQPNLVPISSLLSRSQQLGLGIGEVTGILRLDKMLLTKLERRLIELESIPKALIAALSNVLRTSDVEIRRYLGQAPVLAAGASYRSKTKPTASRRQSFADAIQTAKDISLEDREYWMNSLDESAQ